MKALLEKYIKGKSVLILGYGMEGRSTLNFLKKHFDMLNIGIADRNEKLKLPEDRDQKIDYYLGKAYLDALEKYDVIFKSPGIHLNNDQWKNDKKTLLTQTGIFLEKYRDQVIGITGTKGKSTTASLIHHILKTGGKPSVLVGNIGLPPFDAAEKIDNDTTVVFELSAHQLEHTTVSPHIAVLLNIFPEHLDHFNSFETYANSKLNIIRFQHNNDYFILNTNQQEIKPLLNIMGIKSGKISLDEDSGSEPSNMFKNIRLSADLSGTRLTGAHNIQNMRAAALAVKLAGIDDQTIEKAIKSFIPLEHRLELVGTFGGITFYNDSISTIPESTIEAVKTIRNVDTIILGGYDRGIDYGKLIVFLKKSRIINIIFTGPAGRRMMREFSSVKASGQSIFEANNFLDVFRVVRRYTKNGGVCLLSPAASSYDSFKNFEERGQIFKKLARNLADPC